LLIGHSVHDGLDDLVDKFFLVVLSRSFIFQLLLLLAFLGSGQRPDPLVAPSVAILFLRGPVLDTLIPAHLKGCEAF
jgi:hypothetical protein